MQKELRTLMEQVDSLTNRLTKLEEEQSTENEKAILRRLTTIEKKLQGKTTK